MPWTQKGDYWETPLDVHEQFFNKIKDLTIPTGREGWMIMLTAVLCPPSKRRTSILDLGLELRDAWKALRFQHPGIATELDPSGKNKRYYPPRNEEELEAWANNTFRILENVPSAYEVLHGDKVQIAPPHVNCFWIPATKEVALLSSHWRWDARGSLWVLRDLLSELALSRSSPRETKALSPFWFSAHAARPNLAPSLDELVRMPAKQDWNPDWEVQATALHADSVPRDGTPAFSISADPQDGTMTMPGKTTRLEVVYSATETADILAAIRARGLTVAPAVHASVIEEAVRLNPGSAASRFVSYGIFDLRRYCPPLSNTSVEAVSHRVLGLPLNVPTAGSWDELAETLKKYYGRSWMDESGGLFVRRVFVEQMLDKMGHSDVVVSEPYFNSLGVVDEYLGRRFGDLGVEHVEFLDTNVTRALVIHCFTWKEELHVSLGHNEAFYEDEFVEDYLLAVRENVLENLGLGTERSIE
ncbi:hypothetical protein N7466_007616 [Penicillium verhagenii]|uniref:uncharacterized protein n=1 Tax=Penicillium verhagenii TaxID=1562060 RepID=UPI002545121C|nr:uncharacterized protein N7466_007616 [Penicillium verhagenii]KAJ5928660.1 hypothetical protein N7466_007616 [Penicillium verhagenii]